MIELSGTNLLLLMPNAESGLDLLKFIMPILVETSQWTQILSRRHSPPTSSFFSVYRYK